MDLTLTDIIELASIAVSIAVGYGMLQGRFNSVSERVEKLEGVVSTIGDKVNDHSVNFAEIKSDMKHVMDSLTNIEHKVDKILTKER